MNETVLSKERFKEIMYILQEESFQCPAVIESTTKYNGSLNECLYFDAPQSVHIALELLKVLFNDQNDFSNIDYFCWEENFGTAWEVGDYMADDGSDIPMATPEDLYDVLIKAMEDR